ncbi:Golgi apparatus membrane protein TVP23 homolog B [Geodia barretti]|uniref:Golgi apparatus membrane protein TVP23 homolog n=1 Tax=Geodia barretti TaxID=519541 RepID=A0AA35S8W9_GEOBA|nr:Golgi apparatus membrane protein TVP23 homolog B [Geodia barretti]
MADVAQSFEVGSGASSTARLRHPIAAFFHVFFRASALVVYLILSFFFSDSFVELFISVIILLAFDFWTVKNVTGRLLVGLRWWNKVKDDGSSEWLFEAKQTNTTYWEAVIFWTALIVFPALWILCLFTAILKFSWTWAIIPLAGIALNGSNLVGYVRCKRDARARITAMAGKFIGRQIVSQTLNAGEQT